MKNPPAVGELVLDARRDRIGRVTATADGRLRLRPPSGGEAWDALPCDVRPATAHDALRAKRCEECQRIKRLRSAALEAGDLRKAVELTEAMGVHLRVAHS